MVSLNMGQEATTTKRPQKQQRNDLKPTITEESVRLEQPEPQTTPVEEDRGLVAEELSKEKEKSESLLRRLQYLQADFENYRKRSEREMEDVRKYGTERLLSELIVINDELELGLEKASEEGDNPNLIEGFGMVLKRFQALLAKEGVSRIVGIGKKFDPALHEAALRVPSSEEEGTIIEEIRPGYVLKGRVLRPSIVKVAEGSTEPENGQYKTENEPIEEESRE